MRLYLISAAGNRHVKVGIAKNPVRRCRELQTGCPNKLTIAWISPEMDEQTARDFEKLAHQRLGFRLGGGSEWRQMPVADARRLISEMVYASLTA